MYNRNKNLSLSANIKTNSFILNIIVIFLFCCPDYAKSQNEKIDSLSALLKKTFDLKKKTDIYNDLAYEYLYLDSVKCETYLKKATGLAESINYSSGFARSVNYKGLLYWVKGDNDEALKYLLRSLELREKAGLNCEKPESYMGIGTVYYNLNQSEKSLEYFEKALNIYKVCKNDKGIVSVLNNLGAVCNVRGENRKALNYYFSSIRLAEKTGYHDALFNCYNNIGNTYKYLGISDSAIFYLEKSREISEKMKNNAGIAQALSNIASVYGSLNNHEKALEYLLKSFGFAKKTGDIHLITNSMESLSVAYGAMGNYEQAYLTFREYSLLRQKKLNEESIKQIHEMEAKYENVKKQNEITLLQKNDEKNKNALFFGSIILAVVILSALFFLLLYRSKRKVSGIMELKNKELERLSIVASETENVILIMDAKGKLEWVNESFEKLNDITLKELKKLKGETIFDVSNNPRIREIVDECVREKKSYMYESFNLTRDGKRVWESSTLTPIFDNEGKLKNLIIIDTDVTARKLAEELVKEKNKEILDSINYAKRIQAAILPSQRLIKEYFSESFVLYKPKDIVAGDFYWMETIQSSASGSQSTVKSQIQEKQPATDWQMKTEDCRLETADCQLIFFAVADCTGHGVPGAMVSVVCHNALNRSVREYGLTDPGKILDKTRELVIGEFEKSDEEVKDGMDISLCVFNKNKNELLWAGANNPLWIVTSLESLESDESLNPERENQLSQLAKPLARHTRHREQSLATQLSKLKEFKPDKQPIGKYTDPKPFTTHKISVLKGDFIYIFTDGFADQFGGENFNVKKAGGKKFKKSNLKKLLVDTSKLDFNSQRDHLINAFENWKGNFEHVDDVCIIGIKW